jgi:spore coat polysaccharide biosynthesis protein SpsF
MKARIGIITQARMTSTRLPGKIMMEVNGIKLLKYHTDRLKRTGFPVYIATTVNKTDDCVMNFAATEGIGLSRGSEHDVLSRYFKCAEENKLDVIVRVTSDCPLIDPDLLKRGIEKYLKLNDKTLYFSNALERTFPRGLEFEIFSFALLAEAFQNADQPVEKEHVTPYINRNRSGKVNFYHFKQEEDKSNFRITVDTPEDFQLLKILIEEYNADSKDYKAITKILEEHPELVRINAHIEQKKS